ncbi:MAG: zinc-ribbon domain-containing protein [Deltaproteobacteria bacterium]|nr:MAG: zinc-ribbon domain-containing protein [Deltaproteobacteria bacterium]
MRIECNHCQAVFNVSDEKIPKDRPLKATCSRCRRPLSVGPTQESQTAVRMGGESSGGLDVSLSEVAEPPTAIAADLDITSAYDSPLEVLEEGAMSALVCVDDPERLKLVKEALDDLNYYSSVATSVKEALSKLRYNHYDLVMLDEEFCGETADNNTILRYLQPMPMSTRRRIFLMLISKEMRTLDNLMAFANSVNAVVNTSDVQKMKLVLERALADHRRFYKVYIDTLQALGGI